MKEYVLRNRKGLLLVLIAVLVMGIIEFQNYKRNINLKITLENNLMENKEMLTLTMEDSEDDFWQNTDVKFDFYANAFGINKETLVNLLKENQDNLNLLTTENLDLTIIDYLLELEKTNSKLFNMQIKSTNPNKDYMVALIKYFTNVYYQVDFDVAAAIAQIESGYTSKYMINCNNIFGGMTSSGLIKYRTIEYGILRYIKLLNDGYYSKNLNNVSLIGRVYNPTFNENGEKIANPTWVANVTKALENYQNLEIPNTIEEIINLR